MTKKFTTPASNSLASIMASVTFDQAETDDASNTAKANGKAAIQPSGRPLRIPLKLIRLNLNQPRKLLSPGLSKRVGGGLDLVEAMRQWAQESQCQLTYEYVHGETADPRLRVVRERAWSIYQHGQVEAINVFACDDGSYEVQNGECRTLAHAWLVACGEKRFEQVSALVVERSANDFTKKLVENLEREDLSAIEVGIGAWMARFEMSGQPVPDFNDLRTFNSLAEMDRKREAKSHGLVEWQAVERALGKTMQWRWNATQAFGFPPAAIQILLRNRLTGRSLLPLIRLRDEPSIQTKVLEILDERAAAKGDNIWTQANVSAEIAKLKKAKTSTKKLPTQTGIDSRAVIRGFKQLRGVLGAEKLKGKKLHAELGKLKSDEEIVSLARQLKPMLESILAN